MNMPVTTRGADFGGRIPVEQKTNDGKLPKEFSDLRQGVLAKEFSDFDPGFELDSDSGLRQDVLVKGFSGFESDSAADSDLRQKILDWGERNGYTFSESELADAMAQALKNMQDGNYTAQSKEWERNLANWAKEREFKRSAAYDSAQKEKDAAIIRSTMTMISGFTSIVFGALQFGCAVKAGMASKNLFNIEQPGRANLDSAQAALKGATEPQAIQLAQEQVNSARLELSDLQAKATPFRFKADALNNSYSNGFRSAEGASTNSLSAAGQIGGAIDDQEKNLLNIQAQMSDGNANLAKETAQQRAGDMRDVRKAVEQALQTYTELARIAARSFN